MSEPALGPDELAYYGDGALYDAEYVHIRSDIAHYEGVARRSRGPILELAAGTGRLTFPMALATDQEVVGIDVVPGMIEQARKKRELLGEEVAARTRFELADMRRFDLGQRFDSIVLAFNSFMHLLEDEDAEACLSCVVGHLAPGGRFHLDLLNPHGGLVTRRDPEARYDPQQMIDPRTGARFLVTENSEFDPRKQVNVLRFFYRRVDKAGRPFGEETSRAVRLRVYYPRELDTILRRAGLSIVEDFDDFAHTQPFSGQGGRRVLVAALDPLA
ncbi:MAG: class I SAM-dependent methyltransferase [Deltaproteobacteria bacterium]|nr:class I SAM-dependent methyltransferase [Deltaproteobacteria bacterium]